MSSLRQSSLRLCWLEAFVVVAVEENISKTARVLGVDQSTVSRYLQHLETWIGRKLIEPGKVHDPDDPGRSIELTEAGHDFYDISRNIVSDLNDFRSEKALCSELLADMADMVVKISDAFPASDTSDEAKETRRQLKTQSRVIEVLSDSSPLEVVSKFHSAMREYFLNFERGQTQRKARKRRATTSSGQSLSGRI